MAKSRTKKVADNVLASVLSNVINLLCGLILPRLVLQNFGSAYNGITTSISEFISYISLMQAGIGGATIAALYKPIAKKDYDSVSEILSATEKYMRKIAGIFVAFVVVFAFVYPTFIVKEFDWLFSSTLIVIISISTFVQYYFCFTYQCLLNADQKGYILLFINSFTIILNTFISAILINSGFGIHMVKLGSSIVNVIPSLFVYFYVKNKYPIHKVKNPDSNLISQRWSAAAHEVASFVNDNTDVVVLTLFATMSDISVYTVYHYVTKSIKKIVTSFTVGFGHAFGDMYAKDEIDLMNKNMGIFELLVYSFTTTFCAVCMVMFIPFVELYTKGVDDANYIWPAFAATMTLACAFDCFRVPYKSIVYSIGHYKQTRKDAIIEAVIHVSVSTLGVIKFGVVGIALGSLCAMLYRTCFFAIYLSKHIINRNIWIFIQHIISSLLIILFVYLISRIYMVAINGWLMWVVYAAITTIIALTLVIFCYYFFFKDDFFNSLEKVKVLLSGLNHKK